ncbi:MAG: SRPBCC family protein [Actinomycetota bacterium]|nr:SRPBCC family protein [Actinomycetota bacterium]
MAEQTSSSIRISAAPATVMAVIADFAAYPQWATGVKEADVLATGADGRPERVRFLLNAPPIKDEYTLAYVWDDDREVRWSLVDANVLEAMDGAYVLVGDGDSGAPEGTDVTYRLAVDVAIPMIGMLKRKAEKVIVDTALKGLKQRVEATG